MELRPVPAGVTRARARRRRHRFLLVSIAALAVLAVALGVSFTADTGTTSVSVTAGTTNPLVFPISGASGSTVPSAVTVTKNNTQATGGTTTANALPSWSPAAGAAGSVTSAGDLAVVDGRPASAGNATSLIVTVYITNLSSLQAAYSSYAFPIRVYSSATPTATGNWSVVSATSGLYMTNTGGFLSVNLPTATNTYYLISMDTGGSLYTVSTATAGNLNPSFYFTAQAT